MGKDKPSFDEITDPNLVAAIERAIPATEGHVIVTPGLVGLLCVSEAGQAMIAYWNPDHARTIAAALFEAADRVEGKEPARA